MKGHLLNSRESIPEGSNPSALCGADVRGCRFVKLPDDILGERITDELLLNFRGICKRCIMKPRPLKLLYLAIDGETAKQLRGRE